LKPLNYEKKNWSDEDEISFSYPRISLYEHLFEVASKRLNRVIIEHKGISYTYSELIEASNKLAFFLNQSGINKKDTVAIYLPNSYYFVISLFAAFQVGAKVTLINPRLAENEIQFQLYDSEATVLITSNDLRMKSKAMLKQQALKIKILTDIPEEHQVENGDYVILESILKNAERFTENRGKDEDTALLLYTGGTTATPKAVMLSHSNLIANTMQFNAALDNPPRDPDNSIALGVLPFCHSFGLMCSVLSPLFKGNKIVILSKFNPEKAWEAVEKEKITEIYAVPTMYIALLQVDVSKYDISSLKICVSGGAPLPVNVSQQFYKTTGIKICEGYGLTECSPVTHLNPIYSPKEGSIGLPLIGTEAKLIDPETEEDVRITGEIGELVIKGPQVMLGYYRRGMETVKSFTSDGWLRTGDIASKDDDGYYFIIDRLKEVIISGGLKIYPREVEEIVYKIPGVAYTALIGVSDDYFGEVGKLFVVKKEGVELTEEDIRSFLEDKIAKYKIPKIINFVEELPLSGAGKVLKRKLKNQVSL